MDGYVDKEAGEYFINSWRNYKTLANPGAGAKKKVLVMVEENCTLELGLKFVQLVGLEVARRVFGQAQMTRVLAISSVC